MSFYRTKVLFFSTSKRAPIGNEVNQWLMNDSAKKLGIRLEKQKTDTDGYHYLGFVPISATQQNFLDEVEWCSFNCDCSIPHRQTMGFVYSR